MYKIIVDRECGCFRRSDLSNNIEMESKDEALMKTLEMTEIMNENFCDKHRFEVKEDGDTFIISMV